MKYFVAGFELADPTGEGAALATGAVVDATAVMAAATRTGRAPRDVVSQLAATLGGPVVVDLNAVAAAGVAAAVEAARGFAISGGPVVVRVPYAGEGREVIRAGVAAGLEMAALGCATPAIAVEAAQAGAAWITPALGLPSSGAVLDEALSMLRKTVALLKTAGAKARVLVGPVLDASSLIDVAFAGAHAAAVPAAVLREIARPLAPRGGTPRPAGS
jgi:hypothetical protein